MLGLLILFAWGLLLILVIGTGWLAWTMLSPQRKTYAWALAHDVAASPQDLALQAEEVGFKFRDGTSTRGWSIVGARPEGPIVIITHGWSSSRYQSLPKAARFVRFVSRIILYDLRAHGDSTARFCRLGTREVDDLLEIIAQIAQPDRQLVLFGSSLGSAITISAAARGGDRAAIHGVILQGPFRWLREPVTRQLKRRGVIAQPFAFLGMCFLNFWLRGLHVDHADDARRLNCPLLVIHGSEDQICPVVSARQLAEAAANGRFVEIEAAGHTGLVRTNEEGYLRALDDFFSQINPDTEHNYLKFPVPPKDYGESNRSFEEAGG